MLPRDNLLKSVEHRQCLAHLLDQVELAIKTWDLVISDFLSPPEWVEAQTIFQQLTEVHVIASGGYPQAERQRCGIARTELPLESDQVPLALLDIAGNFLFDAATHRDFLGAILGTGLAREKIGDILVLGERGAQVIVVPELVDFLETHLTQVRSVPVKTRAIDWQQLKARPPRTKQMTTVEASMRLDAIASAGFGMSRSKMADLINTGDVRVNWTTITRASHTIEPGDLVAIRGKGRLQIGDITTTKKQRYRVQLTRYL